MIINDLNKDEKFLNFHQRALNLNLNFTLNSEYKEKYL